MARTGRPSLGYKSMVIQFDPLLLRRAMKLTDNFSALARLAVEKETLKLEKKAERSMKKKKKTKVRGFA